jgi:hypothetical protein
VPHPVPVLLDRIDALLATGSTPAEIERILTDGYAKVLALEGERLRIEQQMEGVAAALDPDDPARRATELSLLARRRSTIDGDVEHLRERLAALRLRARELRTMLPQPQAT